MNWFKGKSLVVPIDYSDESIAAVRFAESVADDPRDIHAIHVIPEINDAYVFYPGNLFDDDFQSRTKLGLEKWLGEIRSNVTSVHVKVGDPGLMIADFANELENAIVITSSHGRTGISRVLLGSVAERTVRLAHCPVLILKPGMKDRACSQERASTSQSEKPALRLDDLREVYSTDDASDAEVLRNALQAEGLKCEVDGETQGGFAGLTSFPVKLLVRAEDFDRARKYIESHHSK